MIFVWIGIKVAMNNLITYIEFDVVTISQNDQKIKFPVLLKTWRKGH